MKNAIDATAVVAVAAKPQIAIDRDSVSRPMTLGSRTINIITAISGAATAIGRNASAACADVATSSSVTTPLSSQGE